MNDPRPHSNASTAPTSAATAAASHGLPAAQPADWTSLEVVTVFHIGVMVVGTTWGFAGAAEWMRPYFTAWGALGVLITLAGLRHPAHAGGAKRVLHWLLPPAAFNVFVLVGVTNPSFREVSFAGETALAHVGGNPLLPSSARPVLGLRALGLFDALWITCFNLALVIRQRRGIRAVLVFVVANALALAVFGTAQKLAQAPGLYFGQVPTPQPYFFATFVYHNHWGAFAFLALAACVGLVWHAVRRRGARDILHSPSFAGLIAGVLLALTIPLSGSRSCTLLLLAFSAGALVHLVVRLVRRRSHTGASLRGPLFGAFLAVALAGGVLWAIGRDTLTARAALTRAQVGAMLEQNTIGARGALYRNTWRMAEDKLAWGWGMASYPHVFGPLYNTQRPLDRLPVFYRDAHSDWLQAFAEHGLIGSALLGLCAAVPLLRLRRRHLRSPLIVYLLSGCGLLSAYAWIEFPFANVSVVLLWWLLFFGALQYARLQDREGAEAAPPRRSA